MGERDLFFPKGQNFEALCNFSSEIMEFPEKGKLKICASKIGFVTPTDMIFMVKSCIQRRRLYRAETRTYFGLSSLDYANNLGFSKALNLKGQPFQQRAFGGENYLPISILTRKELDDKAFENDRPFQEEIEAMCWRVAQVVSQGKSLRLRSALERSFCEIFRNCFEHGNSPALHYCAQHWPKQGVVEICIVDHGMGIKESLAESKYNIPNDDREALYLALMPGVSSKAWRHKKKKSHQKSVWDNAGYGLFLAHQVFGNLGHFIIASGERAIRLDRERVREYNCNVQGTLVSLRLDISNETKITDELDQLTSRAAAVKERLGVKSLDVKSIEAFLRSNEFAPE